MKIIITPLLIIISLLSMVQYSYSVDHSMVKKMLVGTWIGGQYVKQKFDEKSEPFVYRTILTIKDVQIDGSIIGNYKQYKPNTSELQSSDIIENMKINFDNLLIKTVMEDKGKQDAIYGVNSGTLSYDSTDGPYFIRFDFVPYEKYKDHPFLDEYEVWNQYIKDI